MNPNPKTLLEIAGISKPLLGFYDVPDIKPFEPFTESHGCILSNYKSWLEGKSIWISKENCSCQGALYWITGELPEWTKGKENPPLELFAKMLNDHEGFKSSDKLMQEWFENLPPYKMENEFAVLGPLKNDQHKYLKTVTFFVNPDQLGLLVLGAEYNNSSVKKSPVVTAFSSGCGQMVPILFTLETNEPKAMIGSLDIAMRAFIPADILTFTVNMPMFEQLCSLPEDSFLHKPIWKKLRKSRGF